MSYQARRAPQTETLALRGLKFQLYRWPGEDPRPVVLVHGWGDTSETWQFVVDQLPPARTWVAMDMRGFGRTQRPTTAIGFPTTSPISTRCSTTCRRMRRSISSVTAWAATS